MRLNRLMLLLLSSSIAAPSLARDPPTPEQRIHKLELQVRSMNRVVFPKGEPADTAGFSDAPAASRDSVDSLATRLEAVERQMADLVRTSEESTHRLGVMESDLARLKADQDGRLRALERGTPSTPAGGATGDEPAASPADAEPSPVDAPARTPSATRRTTPAAGSFEEAGEAAYTEGFNLWTAKKYDQAITQLRAMVSSFPGHRRVSWANNLIGRSLLDKGQARAAAEALLANYRGDPSGERAPDSLYYLGQALMKINQPTQACKVYDELSAKYGSTMRAPLRAMLPAARAQAQCK